MTAPPFPPREHQNRDTFLALMWALSYPGTLTTIPLHDEDLTAWQAIGDALLDLETTFFSNDESLEARFSRNRARREEVDRAQYLFLPQWDHSTPALLKQASVGSMLYPDQSASIFLGCSFEGERPVRLCGPGIEGSQSVRVSLPEAFWQVRRKAIHFPMGWDVYLVDQQQVIGIPRSTEIVE